MTSLLDEQVQGQDGILDVFRTRRIEQGVGEQWVTIRADVTHDKVKKQRIPVEETQICGSRKRSRLFV